MQTLQKFTEDIKSFCIDKSVNAVQNKCNIYDSNVIEIRKPLKNIKEILTGKPFFYRIDLFDEDRYIMVNLQYTGLDKDNLIIKMNNKDGTKTLLYIPNKHIQLLLENAYLG
jgi:hypothetical protein